MMYYLMVDRLDSAKSDMRPGDCKPSLTLNKGELS